MNNEYTTIVSQGRNPAMNIPNFNETPIGRPPHEEVSVCRAITMTFDINGSAVGQFNSIPFRVREIRVINAVFSDGGDPQGDFGLLWCDIFQTTPVCIVGMTSSAITQPLTTLNGDGGSKIQFNPARDISGQINFRLTFINAQQTPYTLTSGGCSACVIMEFVRGE
jgi:hypothetical protein